MMTTELMMTTEERERLDASVRFDAIRRLWQEAERRRLTACVLLADADRDQDWAALGIGSFSEYVRGLGIPESTARKMRQVGYVFGVRGERADAVTEPMWNALPEVDQSELTVDRLYISAQRVKMGQVDAQTAMHDAVANPEHELLNLRDGQPQVEAQLHRCPLCNQEHVGRVESGELGDDDSELPF